MDMYTVFALTMLVTGFGALALGLTSLHYARQEIKTHRQFIADYFKRACQEYQSDKLVKGKIQTAVMDRIRNLETYRTNHTQRLNDLEDIQEGRLVVAAHRRIDKPELEITDVG